VFNLGPMEIVVLFVIALVVFGPDRLPQLAKEVGRMLKTVRDLSQTARQQLAELSPELGDVDLRSFNPRTALAKALFDGDDDPLGAKGLTDKFKRAISGEDDDDVPAATPAPETVASPIDLTKPAAEVTDVESPAEPAAAGVETLEPATVDSTSADSTPVVPTTVVPTAPAVPTTAFDADAT
jgi:sec-independent protein translocase protein TatB